jgi:DNA-binding NtrC family response regulator
MSRVLIVDDSAMDRELVASILQSKNEIEIIQASSARKALDMIRREPPDLVLTDLIMPEMDGLALTEVIRKDYPALPVILITAHGNEDTVVKALRTGATSYVPKRDLFNDLIPTVTGVLEITQATQQQQKVLSCLVQTETRYVLGSETELIQPLTAEIHRNLVHMRLGDENEGVHVAVALYEAIMNAMYHGNLGLGSDLLQQQSSAYWDLAAKRRHQKPYRDRKV